MTSQGRMTSLKRRTRLGEKNKGRRIIYSYGSWESVLWVHQQPRYSVTMIEGTDYTAWEECFAYVLHFLRVSGGSGVERAFVELVQYMGVKTPLGEMDWTFAKSEWKVYFCGNVLHFQWTGLKTMLWTLESCIECSNSYSWLAWLAL